MCICLYCARCGRESFKADAPSLAIEENLGVHALVFLYPVDGTLTDLDQHSAICILWGGEPVERRG